MNIHSMAITMGMKILNKRLTVMSNNAIVYFHCKALLPVSQVQHLCTMIGRNTFLWENFVSDVSPYYIFVSALKHLICCQDIHSCIFFIQIRMQCPTLWSLLLATICPKLQQQSGQPYNTRSCNCIKPFLQQLHWLLVQQAHGYQNKLFWSISTSPTLLLIWHCYCTFSHDSCFYVCSTFYVFVHGFLEVCNSKHLQPIV